MISIKIRSLLVGGNQGGHSSFVYGADLAVTAWLMSGGMSSWKSKDDWLFFCVDGWLFFCGAPFFSRL
jgi:hypothetical protein